MSQAGKFIPGGGNKAKRTGPIRAPDTKAPTGGGEAPGGGDGKKKLLSVGGLRKPISKGQKWPIYIMSGTCIAALISAGWYFLSYLPDQRAIAAAQQQAAVNQKAYQDELAKEKAAADAAAAAAAAAKGVVSIDSNPTGAKVTVGDITKTTPARIESLVPGSYTVNLNLDGYEDFQTNIVVTADAPVDLGQINLVQKAGELDLASPQSEVTYTLTGPNGYSHQGAIPDKLPGLPLGDYTLNVSQKDWSLAPIPISIADHTTTTKDVKFPYARVTITSVPTGATVRQGRTVLGTTPVTLPPTRPGDLHFSIDLPPYTIQTLDLHVIDFANITKTVTMQPGKDFIAACGLPMIWIPDGGYWAAKYPFPQRDFERVAGYNPSNFRGGNLPVETISWESAQAFVTRLNDYEAKAGKLPQGFHYSLPTESQWEQFNADADMTMAAISSNVPLSSTQPVGYSSPNKYGLYDTIGNVWEWCLDNFDDKGDHSLRGGTWLSLPDNFPDISSRQGGPPKDAEKFIGFRVVLMPNS